jgi:ADP-heptose:LPS heptosyltransferase
MDKTRTWPPDRFAQAAGRLQNAVGGTIVLLGGEPQREDAQAVARHLRGRSIDLSGRTTVPVLGAVISRLALLLTNDSGPAHIGYALGTPTVTIFGATEPEIWGPVTPAPARLLSHPIACRPCNSPDCSIGYRCLAAVSVDEVVEAGLELLSFAHPGPLPKGEGVKG